MGISVLIVGGGCREHALAWKIAKSPLVSKVYAAPGNPGVARHAECVPLAVDDLDGLRNFAVSKKIDLAVVGPEAPLAAGLTDLLAKEGLLVCGPDRAGAQMEGSKVFMKTILQKYGIPTASFKVFDEYTRRSSTCLPTGCRWSSRRTASPRGRASPSHRRTRRGSRS